MCWPCCHPLIWRLDIDGNLVWDAGWDSPVDGSKTARTIYGLATDGTNIFAAGSRASSTAYDASDAYSVKAIDASGSELWQHDTGSDATCIAYWPGYGVLVGHAPSHHTDDPVAITTSGSLVGILTDEQGTVGLFGPVNIAALQAAINTNTRLNGKLTASGTLASLSLQFAASLGGPDGRRPVTVLGAGSPSYGAITSAANFTLLDETDGSVIWQKLIGMPATLTGPTFIANTPQAVVALESVAVAGQQQNHPTPASAKNVATIQPDGTAAMSRVEIGDYSTRLIRRRGLDTDGTDYFAYKYDLIAVPPFGYVTRGFIMQGTASHSLTQVRPIPGNNAVGFLPPIAIDVGGAGWAQHASLIVATTNVLGTNEISWIGSIHMAGLNDFAVLGGGKWAAAGLAGSDLVRVFTTSPETVVWGFPETGLSGYSVINYAPGGLILGGVSA